MRATRWQPSGAASSISTIARFVVCVLPHIKNLHLYDLDKERARQFAEKCERAFSLKTTIAHDLPTVLAASPLISIATTAIDPYISDLSAIAPGSVILHISLRDITPEALLTCESVVDDIDHVCRAQTSVHLAEQLVGHRDFIRGSLAEITLGKMSSRSDAAKTVAFSPFGLGVLDIALSRLVYDLAVQDGGGLAVESFLPDNWLNRD